MSENVVCKFAKKGQQKMSAVDDAQFWAKQMVQRESRGCGDVENAMHRLESRYGISWRTFWSLKYRPPVDVFVGVYLKLKSAYEDECDRQERMLKDERAIAETKATAFKSLVSASDFVAGNNQSRKD
jgi:hypothetical protein